MYRRPNEQRVLPQPSLLEARRDVEDSLIDSRDHRRKGVDDCVRGEETRQDKTRQGFHV
eukprot:COSAG06_NODE_15036_length_1102_cov_1.813559_2_plen_59_part_00